MLISDQKVATTGSPRLGNRETTSRNRSFNFAPA
jgi:hypothetical protein